MTRKQKAVDWVMTEKYWDVDPISRRKQFAREYINGLNNLEFLDLLDKVFGDEE